MHPRPPPAVVWLIGFTLYPSRMHFGGHSHMPFSQLKTSPIREKKQLQEGTCCKQIQKDLNILTSHYITYICSNVFVKISNKPIIWHQFSEFTHIKTIYWSLNQASKRRRKWFKWLRKWHGCLRQASWSECFRNQWSTGIITYSHL